MPRTQPRPLRRPRGRATSSVPRRRLRWSTATATTTPFTRGGTAYAQIPIYDLGSTLSYDCILETGNSNNGVGKLQVDLNACYGKGLAVDGVFGSGTYNALLQVQRTIGVAADGVYGPNTRNKMKWTGNGAASGCKAITEFQGF